MKIRLEKLSLNQRLAAVALLLGVAALFAGDPAAGRGATIDAKELALIVHNQVDHVSPAELADWIIAGKTDYRLVDIRTPEEYALYHIPTSENVPLAGLADDWFLRNEKIILYSEGGIHAAQAWFLLKSQGYGAVYMLMGGLEGWKDEVLFPTLAENASDSERIAFAKTREVSKYFGGTPRTGAGPQQSAQVLATPKLEMPAPAAAPAAGAKKKKKEGC